MFGAGGQLPIIEVESCHRMSRGNSILIPRHFISSLLTAVFRYKVTYPSSHPWLSGIQILACASQVHEGPFLRLVIMILLNCYFDCPKWVIRCTRRKTDDRCGDPRGASTVGKYVLSYSLQWLKVYADTVQATLLAPVRLSPQE